MILNVEQNEELRAKFTKKSKSKGEVVYKLIVMDGHRDLPLKAFVNFLKKN